MIKLNRYSYILMGLMGLSVVACNNNDDVDKSIITSFEKFTFTELPTALVVPEADETYTFNFAFDDKQIIGVTVDLAPTDASTATEGEDFDLSVHSVTVEALERAGEFSITVHSDYEGEGDESVILTLSGQDAHGLPTPQEALVLTIRDSIYPVAIRVDWEGAFEYAGGTYSLCGNADIDFWIENASGTVVDGYQGATGACPENSFLSGLADGEYSIIADLYDNGLFGAPDIDTIPIPLTVSMFKGGVVSDVATTVLYSTIDFAQVDLWTAYTESDPSGAALVEIGKIRVGGGKVTLVNPAGSDVGSFNK